MFSENKKSIEISYRPEVRNGFFNPASGIPYEELKSEVFEKEHELLAAGMTYDEVRARLLDLILTKAQVGVNPAQRFADAFNAEDILARLRDRRIEETQTDELARLQEKLEPLQGRLIACSSDWYHNSPYWDVIFERGLPGIIEHVQEAEEACRKRNELTAEKEGFYKACVISYEAVIKGFLRLAEEADRAGAVSGPFLRALTERAPETLDECLQLSLGLFRVLEHVDAIRTRSLGPVDRLWIRGWRHDIEAGVPEEACMDKLRCFLYQCWAMHIPFDLPLLIGGPSENELSLAFVKAYTSIDIYSPKVHVRYCDKTSEALLSAVLDSIRNGNSSFVLLNDKVVIDALVSCGEDPLDAADYLPIGCYEPYAYGKECGCSGGGGIRIAKAVELALFNGVDQMLKKPRGPATGNAEEFADFETFYQAFRAQLQSAVERMAELVRCHEPLYGTRFPMSLLSATYESALENGRDAFAGGAAYNNTAMNFMYIGSAVDSLMVIKACFEGRVPYTVAALKQMLLADWNGYEKERKLFDSLPRYGNGDAEADALAERVAKDCYEFSLGLPNGRGGVFKPALYSIDFGFREGAGYIASPDGRHQGDPLSRNLSATAGKDRNGVTAAIRSAAKLHLNRFPSGSVLDVMLHPTSVQGEEGLSIMLGLYRTFFNAGGFAMHGNVISADTLIAAQKDPESYATLQVRLCGWNVYFNLLTKTEQDELIRAAR